MLAVGSLVELVGLRRSEVESQRVRFLVELGRLYGLCAAAAFNFEPDKISN